MDIGRKIRELRRKLGLTQEELARRLNMDQTTISYYEAGKRSITIDVLQRIAEALGVPVSYFFANEEVELLHVPSARKVIPVFDTNMTAGNGAFPDRMEPIQMVPVDIVDADYAFIVRGKSMEPEIKDEDIVLVKCVPPTTLQNGDIVVCIYANHFLVKRFYRCGENVVLYSDNTEYAPITINPHEKFEIIGRVVEIRRSPKRRKIKF